MFLSTAIVSDGPSLAEATREPDGVAAWACTTTPGPTVVTPLTFLTPAQFSPAGRVDAVVALEAQVAWLQGLQQEMLVAAAADAPVSRDGRSFAAEEVACALGLSHEAGQARLVLAQALVEQFPATLDLVKAGRLSMSHARYLIDQTSRLEPDQRSAVEDLVLEKACDQSQAEFRRAVRKAKQFVDTRAAEQRHQAAIDDRTVTIYDGEDGMAGLWANLPAAGAQLVMDRLTAMANTCCEHDVRTIDQRRADALIQLAAGGVPSEQTEFKPKIQVTVALSTLLGVDDRPGELAGHGPIPAALAREIAAEPTGTWRRLVTDELGQLIDLGRTQYRPPASMQQHVKARDRTCRFPHCNRAAARTDTDHVLDWDLDGETNAANLQSLCKRHHHTKHDAGWKVTRGETGETRWTSPVGKTYTKQAATYSDPDPPPF